MENNLTFVFKNHNVEVLKLDDVILFNPYHVGACLDLAASSVRNYLMSMNEKQCILLKNSTVRDKDIRKLHNTGEKFITESGVYKLIFKSRKADAEEFQDWVTDDVLPQIRQTGGYVPTQSNGVALTDEEIMAKAFFIATKTIDAKNKEIAIMKNDIAQKECELLQVNEEVENLKPKGEYYDTILKADNGVSISCIADDFGISAIALNKLLHEWGIQYKKGGRWFLYDKYKGLGYVISNTYNGEHTDGTPAAFLHMKWTQIGRKFICGQMKAHGYDTLAEQADNILKAAIGGQNGQN